MSEAEDNNNVNLYAVKGEKFTHIFNNPDEACEFVLGEILVWNGKTREPDCWPYIKEITMLEILELYEDRPIKFHTKGKGK